MHRINRRLMTAVMMQLLFASCAQTFTDDDEALSVKKSELFTNGGFETGTFGSWTKNTYLNTTGLAVVPPTTLAHLNLTDGGRDFSFIRINGVPMSQPPAGLVADAGVPLWPRFDTASAVLNEWGAADPPGQTNHQGANSNVNTIKQSMVTTQADVDPSDGKVHVRFVLAPVLEAAGHGPTQQPYFFVMIRNVSRSNAVMYTNFNFANQTGVPWQSQGTGDTALLYTSWVVFDFAPDSSAFTVGETIEVEVFAAGCEPGGHSGTVYLDGFGAQLPSLTISKTAPASANIDSDITYTFSVKNLTTGIAPNVVADEVLPPNTTFVSYDAPGATCTTPIIGGTGTVSCTYGWLNPGATNTFTVTVRAFGASTQGTATASSTTTITDTAQAWTANFWRGYTVYVTSGTQAGRQAVILSNTTNQLTFSAALPGAPGVGSTFKVINPPGAPVGASTAVSNGSITKAASGWTPNQFLGWNVVMLSGAQAGTVRVIADNTDTRLNLVSNWSTNPAVGDVFAITKPVTSVVNGNYGVTGLTVSRLLGPPRETTFGVGVTYADLSITKSNGVPALVRGQSSTVYSITVSNAGPGNVTGATVADVVPAELLTAAWTCTAGSGASCGAANGTGNINTTVNLISGASATFTLTAAVSDAGVTQTTNVATVTAPGTVTDPFPANNSASDSDSISAVLRVLTVTKSGLSTGLGTVTSAPAAINCGPACPFASASFGDGASVTLTAVAQANNRFVGWGGACVAAGTSATCTLTMSAARNVTVTFSSCGNGTLDSTEGCDDSNVTTGDGCNASCLVETGTVCNANASGLVGNFSCASGICDTVGNAAPGRCEAVGACGNSVLEAGEGCDDGLQTAGGVCNASCLINTTNPCNATAPGSTGNASCASGVCDAVGNAAPGICEPVSTCGNGVREGTEGCDDGLQTAGGVCNASCLINTTNPCNASAPGSTGSASCASGVCDAIGNAAPGLCEPVNTCGNGVREGTEGCDDGLVTAGGVCNASCLINTTNPCNGSAPGSTGNASCASGRCDTVGNALPGVCEPTNTCGNGVREGTEGCDDGNLTAGDGCNATCLVETGTACNGTGPGSTGNASCASGRCDTLGNAAPGVCEAVGACGNGLLEAGEGCDDGNLATSDGCNAACRVETGSACNATGNAGLPGNTSCASLLCDTVGNAAPGVCEAAGVCGNSVRETGEGCDDGNLTTGDGCNATCLVETGTACNASSPGNTGNTSCASGICDTAGNAAPGRCEAAATCGNSVREAGEGCDDGNATAGDGCSITCKVESGSACNASMPGDTGNTSCASGLCDSTGNAAPGVCEPTGVCGNAVRETGEGCDDGNLVAGDGCTATCFIETGLACNAAMPGATGSSSCASGNCNVSGGAPGVCRAVNVCGNGLKEAGEGCDDNNTTAGDGCSATCLIENGRVCASTTPGFTDGRSCQSGICDALGNATPGLCEPVNTCGNSVREAGEGCDDGNITAGDGCNASCLIETSRACNAAAPGAISNASCASGVCDTTGNASPGICEVAGACGNGVREAGEGCDDGNASAGDGCTAACLVETGGACNVATPGATGNDSCASGDCNTAGGSPGVCRGVNVCGNGVREAAEGCDDNNTTAGDGCSATCLIETGTACNASSPGLSGNASCASGVCDASGPAPGVCEAAGACGNGVREAGEGCDDGFTTPGDGCSATCLVENGKPCNGSVPGATGGSSCASGVCDSTGNAAPGVCEAASVCGNGLREAGEGCDDGNVIAGDGCSATCLLGEGQTCNATPPGATGSSSCASGQCDTSGGAPGKCSTGGDRDGDGVRDNDDLDDDDDGITDAMEGGPNTDTDGDSVPDRLDLDSDNDGILDAHEAGHTLPISATGVLVCAGGFGTNGLCDALETSPGSGRVSYTGTSTETTQAVDTDGDGVPDFRDLDSDNDGILDAVEGGGYCLDADSNGLCDGPDGDGDGISSSADPSGGKWGSGTSAPPVDTDGDTVPDFRDLDADNDGLPDLVEGGSSCTDADRDALCDGTDGDGDGLPATSDGTPSTRGTSSAPTPPDTDGDSVPDFRDLDSDDDGLSDLVEGGATCTDADNDAVCDKADTDHDGLTDTADGKPQAFGSGPDKHPKLPDTDSDGSPDFRDVQSKGDGTFDISRAGKARLDADGDGRIDPGGDADHDGLRDSVDTLSAFGGLPVPPGYRVIGGGCGCTSVDDSPLPMALLLLGLFGWAAKRRRLHRSQLTQVARASALVLCVLLAPSASAQTSTAIDVQQFKPGPGRYDLLNVMSTQTCGAGCFSTGLWFQYSRNPLLIADLANQRIGQLVDNQLTADLLASYGLTDRIELGFHLPLYIQSTGASDLTNPKYFGPGWVFGAGDLRVVPRLRLVNFDFGLSLGLALPVLLPTGRTDAFMGGGYLGLQPRLLAEFKKGGLTVDVNLGVNFRHFQQLANVSAANEFAWSAAGEYRFSTGQLPLSVLASIHGIVGLRDGSQYAGDRTTEVDVGLKSTLQDTWAMGLTVGRGIISGVGAPDIRVALNVSYTPTCGPTGPSDADGDGLPDSIDQCPNDPEDRDCFQDDDGCPDPDNDQDGILDRVDACPLEKETVNGFRDDDGCPEKDTDGDKIIDDLDKCVTVAENINGIEDTDGCPELDSDGDGLYDSVDKCPNAAEDKDGFEDDDGCPDLDNDKDGIPDLKDKCPLQPETINGVEDTDGCPDQGAAKVKLEGNKILILDKVYFATGQDVILARSFNLLTQVASTLLAHEELKKIRVEGHTDDRGDDAANLDLSQRRAASVRRFLVERGIAGGRLESVGYGETKPVVANTTAANREMNRRVEFVVVDSE